VAVDGFLRHDNEATRHLSIVELGDDSYKQTPSGSGPQQATLAT
jgi:hypothetical protein